MARWNLEPMHISLWPGESGGHGHSMQSFAYPDLIGCFGSAIVGSIVTDTASLAIAHYRSEPILAASRRTVPDYLETPSSRRNSLQTMTLPVGRSVDFVDLHGGVDGEIGIANGGAGRRRQVARRGGEFTAGTFHGVGITVALGAGHGKRIGGDEFVERSAMAVRGDVAAFRLGDLQEIASNARQADGLRWSGTFIRCRHSLQIEVIHDKEKGCTNKNADKRAHERIVCLAVAYRKRSAPRGALGNNLPRFRPESQP